MTILVCVSEGQRASIRSASGKLLEDVLFVERAETLLEILRLNVTQFSLLIIDAEPATAELNAERIGSNASDGWQLLKDIQLATSTSRPIPVIVSSRPLKISQIENLLESGASYFVPFPLHEETLTTYMSRALRRQPDRPHG